MRLLVGEPGCCGAAVLLRRENLWRAVRGLECCSGLAGNSAGFRTSVESSVADAVMLRVSYFSGDARTMPEHRSQSRESWRARVPANAFDPTSMSLLQRARSNDQEAWHQIVHLYGPLVHKWCRRSNLQDDDLADVFQETFRSNEVRKKPRLSSRQPNPKPIHIIWRSIWKLLSKKAKKFPSWALDHLK